LLIGNILIRSRERGYVHIKGTFSKGLYNRRQRELKLWDRK